MKDQMGKRRPVRRLYRRTTTMAILDCGLNMVKRLEKGGRLKVIRLGSRDIFHPADQVDALARGEEAGND